MAKTHNSTGKLGLTFGVMLRPTGTTPLDDRLVVDSVADLTNGTITAPYQGMVVNIAGTSELWVLKTQGIAESKVASNWEKIGNVGSISNLKYAEDDDIDNLCGSEPVEDAETKIVTIKSLDYFYQKIQNDIALLNAQVETIEDTYATKEYVDDKTSWGTNLPS